MQQNKQPLKVSILPSYSVGEGGDWEKDSGKGFSKSEINFFREIVSMALRRLNGHVRLFSKIIQPFYTHIYILFLSYVLQSVLIIITTECFLVTTYKGTNCVNTTKMSHISSLAFFLSNPRIPLLLSAYNRWQGAWVKPKKENPCYGSSLKQTISIDPRVSAGLSPLNHLGLGLGD